MLDPNQILDVVFKEPVPLQVVLIAVATILQEDVTALAIGAILATGSVRLAPAAGGILIGASLANLVFWGAGRILGPAAFQLPMLRKAVGNGNLDRARAQFERSGFVALLVSRFVPGTRVPVCAVAGVLGMSLPRFALYSSLAVLPWTALMLWIPDRIRSLAESGLLWWILPILAIAVAAWFLFRKRKRRTA